MMDKQKLKQNMLLVAFGIVFYLVLQNIERVLTLLAAAKKIFMPFIYGFVLAYILNIPYKWYKNKALSFLKTKGAFWRKMQQHLSVLLAYLTVLLSIVFLFWIIIPQLLISARIIIQNIPFYVESLELLINKLVEDFQLQAYYSGELTNSWLKILQGYTGKIDELLPNLIDQVLNLTNIVFNVLIGVAFSVYLIYSKETLIKQLRRIVIAFTPEHRSRRILEICSRANQLFTKFIVGNLMDSLIVGVLCFIGMSVFRFPYPLLVSAIIGVTNIIPILGPFLGAIPSALIILIINPLKALLFLLFVLVLQQIDGNVIKPRLFGNQLGLPSLWVLMAIVVGGRLFGIPGMLMGVPLVALIYSVLKEKIDARLRLRLEKKKEQNLKTS